MELRVGDRKVTATTGGRQHDHTAPLMVFVHGAGNDRTAWQLQTRHFAHHGHRVLAVDLPGHGRSEGPPPDSIGGYAEWLTSVLDVLAADRADLVGHSMGSLIALELAGNHPERVSRLALLGTSPTMGIHPDLMDAAQEDQQRAFDLITGWTHSPRGQFGMNQTPGIWMRGTSMRLLQTSKPGVLANDLAACARYDSAIRRASAVTAPTLVLLGGRDLMTRPRTVPPLAAALRHPTLVTLPDAGHSMMTEQPNAVIDALDEFLRANPTQLGEPEQG